MGWLSGWAKRINGTVVRPEGAVTDYQVPISIAEGGDLSLCPCDSLSGWSSYGAALVSLVSNGDGTNHIAIAGSGPDGSGIYYVPSALQNWSGLRHLGIRARRSAAGIMYIYLFSGALNYPPYVTYAVNVGPEWQQHIIDLTKPYLTSGEIDMRASAIKYIRCDVDGAGVVLSVDDIRGSYNLCCLGECLPTFDDVRFTLADGETLLPYWIESISGLSPNQVAHVWLKCPTIGATETLIYAYYGNPDAEKVSDGASVFSFFDDFNDNILSANWEKTETKNLTVAETGGVLTLGGLINAVGGWDDCYAQLTQAMTDSYAVGAKMKITGSGTGYGAYLRILKDASNSVRCYAWKWTSPNLDDLLTYTTYNGGVGVGGVLDPASLDGQYHGVEIAYDRSSGTVKFYQDGVCKGTATIANLANATTYVHLGGIARIANDVVTAQFDNFYIRKYVSPEPTPPLFDWIATASAIAAKEQHYRRLRNG